MALQAGASGLPFTPVPGLIGSDLMRVRDDFLVITNPYDESRIAAVPAINPEFALVHALRADPDGNLVVGASGDEPLVIQASRCVIATVEEISPTALDHLTSRERVVPDIHIDAIVPVPMGSHPLGCQDRYHQDAAHIQTYVTAAREPETFAAYLHRYVFEPADHAAYLSIALGEPAHV